MRSFALALVASIAGALAATMHINASTFRDHMALTVLEGLSGIDGQQIPAVSGRHNVVDMVMSKLATITMDTAATDSESGIETSTLG
ncbi:hypothetical protein QR685DRAFT_554543 [Neurospora intermedia]|uniref:Uncharacterized protein n=1 Tax=Neurospora intermedia TaxID=5142 RepID=A0ABR3DAY7_NEUIN